MINESYIAGKFKKSIAEYPQYSLAVKNIPGISDLLIQLPGGKCVFVEFKRVSRFGGNKFSLTSLTNYQAAFLAKWQMHGGNCFLFAGATAPEEPVEYIVVKLKHWKSWLSVNEAKHSMNEMALSTSNIDKVGEWFRNEYGRLTINGEVT